MGFIRESCCVRENGEKIRQAGERILDAHVASLWKVLGGC